MKKQRPDLMTVFNHPLWKYLPIIPILICAGFILYNAGVSREITETLLNEKFEEKMQTIDGIAGDIDGLIQKDNDWDTYDYEWMLAQRMTTEDEKPYTFAALYSEGLDNLSARHPSYTSAYEPLEISEFRGQVQIQESGIAVLPFTPEGQPERDMHIYFRWVPTDDQLEHRYLLVVAISKYSITNKVTDWVGWGAIAQTIYTFIVTVFMTLIITRGGTFLGKRTGPTVWRGKQ